MSKKQKKSKRETSAETYFPVDKEDLKHTTEKIIKDFSLEIKKIKKKKVKNH